MLVVRVLVGVLWVMAAIAGHEMWTPGASAGDRAVPARAETTSISISGAIDSTDHDEIRTQPHVDVYGNRIDEAVGDYRIDPRGDVYEWHSPDTAILKLGPPGA